MSIPVNQNFYATQTCPTYITQNDYSEAEDLTIHPNQPYVITAIDKNSDRVHIELPNQHIQRWVAASCGFIAQELSFSDCNHQGDADSYVLALSSQPGFCETYGYEMGKPECLSLAADSYHANHLSLHGLWPNKNTCGQHYGYCGVKSKSTHCDYAPLQLTDSVANRLKVLMPSFQFGSCLERHEWNKHGSCQVLSTDDYFDLAMRLTTEVNQSILGQYLTDHRGKTIELSELQDKVVETFGNHNTGKFYFGCKNKILVDFYIQLPALIPFNAPLQALIDEAPDNHTRDACPKQVIISNFNQHSWL